MKEKNRLKNRIWSKPSLIERIKIHIYAWADPQKASDMLKKYEHLEFD